MDLLKTIRKKDFDVIIIEGYNNINNILISLWAKKHNKKLIFRGEAYNTSNQRYLFQWMKRLFLRNYFKIYDSICYSCSTNKEYFISLKVPEKKLLFVPSAVDNSFFSSHILIQDKKKDVFKLLGAGRFVERKRWNDLIEAMKYIPDKSITLDLVGNGPLFNILKELVKNENLKDRVFFPGFKNQTEIITYYQNADVLVLTSDYDPSPKVLNEALNFGLPIIVSDKVGTAKDLCISNGYIFNCGDIQDLAQKIQCLKEDLKSNSKELKAASKNLANLWSVEKGATNILDSIKRN